MKPQKHKLLLFLLTNTAFIIINLLHLTLKYRIKGAKPPYPHAIYAFWHKDIIPLLISRKREQVVIMVSTSKDGDFIAEPAKLFGYKVVRGSSSTNGANALKEMIKLAKSHSLAITPDGPKGPPQIIKEGVLQLAYLSKLPIIATKTNVSKAFTFNSWDRFYVPKPFAMVDIEYSEPIYVSNKSDFEMVKHKLEDFMNAPCP